MLRPKNDLTKVKRKAVYNTQLSQQRKDLPYDVSTRTQEEFYNKELRVL